MNARRHRPPLRSLTRVCFVAPDDAESIDETDIEALLAVARDDSRLVSEYDTGRGRIVWFTAPAGERTRQLARTIAAMLPADWTRE